MSDHPVGGRQRGEVSGVVLDGLPDTGSVRAYVGGWAQLSVVQYFVAESAVIEAWGGPRPYDRRTGFISDLGAINCGIYEDRSVCSPLHALMNASFVVQGLGMVLGALLLSTALLCIAARPGVRPHPGYGRPWFGAAAVRILTGMAGVGTIIVGLIPEDLGSPLHLTGALMFFIGGGAALLVLGFLWARQTPMSWFIGACGTVTFTALAVGGLTAMQVPEPGTLERLMAYPVTIGFSAAGLVIAQRVRRQRAARARTAHLLPDA